jgi:crossover junction endodeoxyribonuclease RuvC
MVILGIDPGMAQMGWGVVQQTKSNPLVKHIDHGLIQTSPNDTTGKRLSFLKRDVIQLLKIHEVDEVVAEKIFFNVNKRSAISVGQALGVVHLAAAEADLPVYEYNALEAKLLIAGHGRADKKVVQKAIKKELRLKKNPTPVHAADALAIALCHILKNHGA